MFFHTKQRSEKNSKRQSKNKLPKLSAIDPQVKDFFPFKIRPDSAKTSSKTSNSKLDTTDSSKFDDTSSNVTTSTVTMTTKSRCFLSSGTHQNNFRYLSGTKNHKTPQAHPSTQKLTTKSNPRILISEDPKLRAFSENVEPLREVRRKEGVCRQSSPERLNGRGSPERLNGRGSQERLNGRGSPERLNGRGSQERLNGRGSPERLNGRGSQERLNGRGSPERLNGRGSQERLNGRGSTDRVCRPERQILYRHRAPYYEEYCKKNFPRSLTNVR